MRISEISEGLIDYSAPAKLNKGAITKAPHGKRKPDMFGRNFKTSKPSKTGQQPHPLQGKLVGGL